MSPRRAILLLVVAFPLGAARAQCQTLIYALSYTDTRAGLHARFPNGALGASAADKLAMLRGSQKTEVYAYSAATGEKKLVFSDEGMNLEIVPTGPVLDKDRVFASGVMREWRTGATPGAYADAAALYEIRLDGSKQFRRLQELQPNQTPAVLNWQRTKAAIESTAKDRYILSIFEVPGWKPLYRWEMSKLAKPHCPDCLPMSYGWLASGDKVFVHLDTGDEDSIDPKNHNVPGIYVASEQGDDLGGMHRAGGSAGKVNSQWETRGLIAQLPDGRYVFEEYVSVAGSARSRPQHFLVIVGSDASSAAEKRIPIHAASNGSLVVAPSGRFASFIEDRMTPDYRTEHHLWLVDLQSGAEKELLAVPPPNPPTSLEPNITLRVLGWEDDRP